ncbi:hypothetical protein TNCV_3195361 [Trichonephila clavipes]|uniref:Uncharacterized protein n=1 Tax=Trichonephila clavipes TaxID=2585209 RepID=A0A8X6UWS0_TRICX|nr:hypothetical protein TNCV_3195361 [Trichonephila clavipes]
MSACGREFHIACMRSKSLSFEAAGRGSQVGHRLTESHTCSIGDYPAISRSNRSLEESLQHVGVHYPAER